MDWYKPLLDFDGDEINVHIPQTIEAYAEAEQLLAVRHNLMSAQTNRPMIGIVYDTLSGAYLMTYPEEEIERIEQKIFKAQERYPLVPIEIQAAKIELAEFKPDTEEHNKISEKIEKLETELNGLPITIRDYRERQGVLFQRININPVTYNLAIDNVINTPQFATFQERLNRYGINPYGGKALISSTFPENFDYTAKDPKTGDAVIIKDGILIKGILTKDVLGNKDGSIIAEMVKQLGGDVTVDFMSNIQFVVRDYLQQHGLSVGYDDCMPNDPMFRENLDEVLATANLKVIALSRVPTSKIIAEQQERKIGEILDIAKTEGDKIVQKYFHPDNAILIMANSGAKGTVFNATQMSSALGQQKVTGKRIQSNLAGNRALPSIQPNSTDPRDKGFCVNSFSSGLESKEFFFHAQGGREGLTDTAINTSETGFLQHQIIKSAEDVIIAPDGSVRVGDNAIMQFIYGDDGMDASQMGSVKLNNENIPMFRNFEQLASKINRKYGGL
jgi:DNA-directed RNA polymerase beta' subunit